MGGGDSKLMHPLISRAKAKSPFFVGIDLGGTSVKLGVVDDRGQTLLRFSIPTETEKGPEDASRRMGLAVHRAIEEAGLERSAIAGERHVTWHFWATTSTFWSSSPGASA